MATYDSYSDAIENAPIGSTISYSQAGGVTVDESTSEYELIGDQAPLDTPAESAALDDDNGSTGADTSGGGYSVPEAFREDESYGMTSTGQNGGSESPPDNGGYENPPRISDSGAGRDSGVTGGGSSSAGSDPVSDAGGFSIPEIFRRDDIYSAPAADDTKANGFTVPEALRLDENYSPPPMNDPVIDGGPQWFTVGVAAVAALGAGLLIAGRE